MELLHQVYTIHAIQFNVTSQNALNSQLALSTNHLHETSAVAQNNLALVILRDEADFLKAILAVSHPPNLRSKLVTWFNRRGKARLEFLEVLRVATSKFLQNTMGGRVPAIQAMDNATSEAHFLTGFRSSMQRVVVAIESV